LALSEHVIDKHNSVFPAALEAKGSAFTTAASSTPDRVSPKRSTFSWAFIVRALSIGSAEVPSKSYRRYAKELKKKGNQVATSAILGQCHLLICHQNSTSKYLRCGSKCGVSSVELGATMSRKLTMLSVAAALASCVIVSGSACAAVIDLTFEGINVNQDSIPNGGPYAFIQNFYNGGTSDVGTSGPNFGIGFSSNAQAICLNTTSVVCSNTSRGGLGDPASQRGGLFFLSGSQTFMNVPAGFDTGFSFNYSAVNTPGSVSVFSGLDGTGTLLATLAIPTTPSGACVGFAAPFCPFVANGIAFAGTAMSVSFAGVANQVVFDDVTFGSTTPGGGAVPLPAAFPLFATGLGALGFLGWRRKQKAATAAV
jgi:hypothetical protein